MATPRRSSPLPDKAKDKLVRDLQAYSEKKIKNLKTDAGTEHYANLDSVQAFVKDRFPTKLLSRKDCDSKACDDAIREAIIATIKATPGKSLKVDVAGGKVTAIRNQLEPARIGEERRRWEYHRGGGRGGA